MPKITRFPFFGKRFFRQARKMVGSPQFEHLWRLVIAIAGMHGRRSLQRIEAVLDEHRTRQAIAHFLTQAEWNAPELLWQTALQTLTQLGWQAGDLLHLILDDTQKRKRGKRMDAVSKIFLHAEKVYAHGHTILGAALVYRGVVIPCAARLWVAQRCCAEVEAAPGESLKFRKLTHLTADLVGEFRAHLPTATRGVVLFDSYYLCPMVTQACEQAQLSYIGVAKKNRNFAPDGRPRDKRKLGQYGANVLRREGRATNVTGKKHVLAERVGNLSKAGRVKLVFSRRPRESAWIALSTNNLRWCAKTVVEHYLVRWGIELLFKASKQYLGLGDYQLLTYRGVVRYLHLVLIAYLLLTQLALVADAQACAERLTPLRLPGIPQLQQQLRSQLWDALIVRLERSPKTRPGARKIKELIHQ